MFLAIGFRRFSVPAVVPRSFEACLLWAALGRAFLSFGEPGQLKLELLSSRPGPESLSRTTTMLVRRLNAFFSFAFAYLAGVGLLGAPTPPLPLL